MKKGSIVKFHTPFPDENPEQTYVVLFVYPEWIQDYADGSKRTYQSKCDIKALNTGMVFPGISSVHTADLIEVDNVFNYDLSKLELA